MRLAVLLVLIAAPALAAPETGLFHDGVGGCEPARAGLADGPVRVSPDRLEAARGTCDFTGETRFFLSFTQAGVTVVSPAWGTWALGRCP